MCPIFIQNINHKVYIVRWFLRVGILIAIEFKLIVLKNIFSFFPKAMAAFLCLTVNLIKRCCRRVLLLQQHLGLHGFFFRRCRNPI